MYYVLSGTESYLIKKRVKEIIQNELKENASEAEYYSLKDTSLQTIFDEAQTIPLFASKRVMIIENCDFLKKSTSSDTDTDTKEEKGGKETQLSIFASEVSRINEDSILIFIVDGGLSTKKQIKEALEKCKVETFNILEKEDRIQYIQSFLKQEHIELSDNDKSYLISILPQDLFSIKNELNKLALYGDMIDRQCIDSLITKPLEDNVFEWTNAILKKNTKRIFSLWQDFKQQSMRPVQLCGLLAAQFRFDYQVLTLVRKGYNDNDIAKELGVTSARVYMTLKEIRNQQPDTFLYYLSELSKFDMEFKSGKIDEMLGFELFLLKMGEND